MSNQGTVLAEKDTQLSKQEQPVVLSLRSGDSGSLCHMNDTIRLQFFLQHRKVVACIYGSGMLAHDEKREKLSGPARKKHKWPVEKGKCSVQSSEKMGSPVVSAEKDE